MVPSTAPLLHQAVAAEHTAAGLQVAVTVGHVRMCVRTTVRQTPCTEAAAAAVAGEGAAAVEVQERGATAGALLIQQLPQLCGGGVDAALLLIHRLVACGKGGGGRERGSRSTAQATLLHYSAT